MSNNSLFMKCDRCEEFYFAPPGRPHLCYECKMADLNRKLEDECEARKQAEKRAKQAEQELEECQKEITALEIFGSPHTSD